MSMKNFYNLGLGIAKLMWRKQSDTVEIKESDQYLDLLLTVI